MSEEEVIEIIAAHRGAILAVLGGAVSYNLNTGHGQQSVTRANLRDVRESLDYWEEYLAHLRGSRSDIVSILT